MKCNITSVLLGCMCIGLVSCLPFGTTPVALETEPSPQPTFAATETIEWFPPTRTYTPLPTITQSSAPAHEQIPLYDTLLFSDDFSDPSLWTLDPVDDGRASVNLNQLTLAVSIPEGYLYSLRESPTLSDFYLEITAHPRICRGSDEYGVLLRVTPSMDFFRFALLCNGNARIDRYIDGAASSPIPPTLNAAIPRGAPSVSRISILSKGKEMHFYTNGVYLFTVRDASSSTGTIGLFVRAAGEDLVSVNFSDLEVYNVNE